MKATPPGVRTVVAACAMLLAGGCASYRPVPLAEVPFRERIATQSKEGLRVSVVALGPEESKKLFGVDVAARDIQPVWVEIENTSEHPLWFYPSRMDPDYYSPGEVAYKNRIWCAPSRNRRMRIHFESMDFPSLVAPGQTAAGFVHTLLDPGLKYVNVSLIGFDGLKSFHFVVPAPGIKADYQEVDLKTLYAPGAFIDCDEAQLRAELLRLPACTTNSKGTRPGDPLNLVFLGDEFDLLTALVGGGWDVTEKMSCGAVWRTVRSSLFGKRYRHSPVSSLYVFGRRQEAAFQKARETVDERNHLRVWLTPLRCEGLPVWIGQISRDIGVKLTLKTGFLTTHVIDPDVDNDRYFLMQNLADARALTRFGYIAGVGSASADDPRHNLGGDPYYTDGLRAVIECTEVPVEFSDIAMFNWDWPPQTQPYIDAIIRSRSLLPAGGGRDE